MTRPLGGFDEAPGLAKVMGDVPEGSVLIVYESSIIWPKAVQCVPLRMSGARCLFCSFSGLFFMVTLGMLEVICGITTIWSASEDRGGGEAVKFNCLAHNVGLLSTGYQKLTFCVASPLQPIFQRILGFQEIMFRGGS